MTTEHHREDVTVEAPGIEEVAVAPWPILLRRRMLGRVTASDRYPWIVLCTVLFGLFTVGFTITILAVSIPRISRDLGASESSLTWVITGPLLAFGVLGPAVGKLADLWGARRVYLLGMLGAAVFAALTSIAWSAPSLILFRVLGASEGAATGPASMAIINRVFPRERRAFAMGFWSLVGAGAPVVGVVAGGPIVEAFGWRWIFVAQVPLTLAGLLVAAIILPPAEPTERTGFDLAGAVLLALGITSVLLALNRAPGAGWSDPIVVAGFLTSPLALALFVVVERRSPNPLIPLDYLKRRNVAFPIATQFFANFAYMGGFIITPLLLQNLLGYSETKTGLLSIARPLTFSITGPVAGWLAIRIGERTSAIVGTLCVVASMVALSTVGASSTDLVIVGALALSGMGLGASSPSMAATIANAVDERDLGIAGAAQQMMTQVGTVAGIQVMQTVQAAREGAVGAEAAYHEAYLVGAAVAAIGVVTAAFVRSSGRTVGAERYRPEVLTP